MKWDNLQKVLEEYAAYFQNGVQTKMPDTYRIKNSIVCDVVVEDYVYTVTFDAPKYFKYLEDGRGPGKRPPIDVIEEWIRVKKIRKTPDKNGNIPSDNSVAWAIATTIGNFGTSIYRAGGLKLFERTYAEDEAYWEDKIIQSITEDVREDMKLWFADSLGPDIINL